MHAGGLKRATPRYVELQLSGLWDRALNKSVHADALNLQVYTRCPIIPKDEAIVQDVGEMLLIGEVVNSDPYIDDLVVKSDPYIEPLEMAVEVVVE